MSGSASSTSPPTISSSGLNPLEYGNEDERERVADDTLSIFKRRFQRFWGPQTDDLFKGASALSC